MRKVIVSEQMFILAAALSVLLSCSGGGKHEEVISSRSYQGHESDLDTNNFVNVYPAAVGTRLDDCQTCHKGATFTYDDGGEIQETTKNACDFCHLIIHPAADYLEPMPTTYEETLNPYGLDYLNAGRTRGALRSIAGEDSDGDGFAGRDEIADIKYPGDPDSKPGQETAPMKVLAMAELQALPSHTEFLLCNTSKQAYDNYATYKGVTIRDLLQAAGVDPASPEIQGITVIAPDGFMKDFDVEDINGPFPAGLWYPGMDTATLGAECGFVQYPDLLPDGLTDGGEIPGEQWLMLAYERDGVPMDPSNLDITSGKINGEGPLRLVVPQATPGSPDRGSSFSPTTCADGLDFDDSKDHNAGAMVRGVVAIRVNPLPTGFEDFDYKYGGWAYIDSESVIVYGTGVVAP